MIAGASASARELAPDPRDVDVERVVLDDRAVRPRRADQLAAREHLPGAGGERGEQPELGRRQLSPVAPSSDDRVLGRVEAQPGRVVGAGVRLPSGAAARRSRTTTSSMSNGFVT